MKTDLIFSEEQEKLMKEISGKFSPEQQAWLGGFLTGKFMNSGQDIVQAESIQSEAAPVNGAPGKVKILYGSRTGNSKKVAAEAAEFAASSGMQTELVDMNEYNVKNLKKEKFLLIIVSTDGEGEAPVPAQELYDFIHGKRAPELPELSYAVLALGDSSYKYFCKSGVDFDNRLEELGATRLFKRIDCDLDFEEPARKWYGETVNLFRKKMGSSESPIAESRPDHSTPKVKHDRMNPFPATIIEKIKLNGRGSDKNILHLELSLEGSDITFSPGDSLGIIAPNPEGLVDQILERAKIRADSMVKIREEETTIREALINDLEITCLTRQVLSTYTKYLLNDNLSTILDNEEGLMDFIYGRDFLDILDEFPSILSANELVAILRQMPPRLYSIASCQQFLPDEVHLTVNVVQYERNGRKRTGACSGFLSEKNPVDSKVMVYVDPNESFRLPDDAKTPIIMIGPGTGVAPFRSFLQARELVENRGKSWLFFGDRHFTTDFLYQTDWQKFKKKGVLTNLDLAFSRDQKEKVYVQDKMRLKGKELNEWIMQGAHIYICGDKSRMARDVKDTLLSIIESEGGISHEKAVEIFKSLRKTGRMVEDVY
ncbi:MAG: assimilatory sulfite reductase (NADPH) flavoprotein subunit [Bacteroidales bacterium]